MRRRQPGEDLFDYLFAPLLDQEALSVFGLPPDATRDDLMAAYRQKVKDMSDGKGGYTGDMDRLVEAKEQALRRIEKRGVQQ